MSTSPSRAHAAQSWPMATRAFTASGKTAALIRTFRPVALSAARSSRTKTVTRSVFQRSQTFQAGLPVSRALTAAMSIPVSSLKRRRVSGSKLKKGSVGSQG